MGYTAGFICFSVLAGLGYGAIAKWSKPSHVGWFFATWLGLVMLAMIAIAYHDMVSASGST